MTIDEETLAQGLGWFSIGLGVAELLAPENVGRAAGINQNQKMLRAAGARELMSGIGILSNQRPAGWVWSRVAGDAMDIGLLMRALSTARSQSDRRRATTALATVVGITALDIYCGLQLSAKNAPSSNGRASAGADGGSTRGRTSQQPLRTSIVINRPLDEVYAFWRNLENLPLFMAHLKSVTVLDGTRSRWVAKGPAGSEVTWEAEIMEEKPNELIAWQSLPGATVDNAGTVRFETAPGNRGTIVRVKLQYRPPGGVVTSTAICGSDLHIYDGFIPTVEEGDIIGHEFMGEVVEAGPGVKNLKAGDRVVVPFPISCGSCFFCQQTMFSLCDNSNPNAYMAQKVWGQSPSGIYGYSHLLGGYAGGQAEYVRVPYADVDHVKIPENLTDEQVLFLSDILPTGYMAAENCNIQPGDTVAVWGCGPVGQFAIASAYLLGAERVIAIDRFPYRLKMAHDEGGAEIINYEETNTYEALMEMTGGRGPDSCIDAVGMEAHGAPLEYAYDRAKQALMMEPDRPIVFREALRACRKGGTVSVAGVYGAMGDKIPLGSMMNKALTIKTGQTHVQRYMKPLLDRIIAGDIDPSFIITHRLKLEDAPGAYKMFAEKRDDCMKVVLNP